MSAGKGLYGAGALIFGNGRSCRVLLPVLLFGS